MLAKRWTYAISKISSGKFGMACHWPRSVPLIGVRPFNPYGPGQMGESLTRYLLNNCIDGDAIRITCDGSQFRTYCYIADLADGIDVLLYHREQEIGTPFNIGRADEMMSIASLLRLAREISGARVRIEFIEHQGDDVMVHSPSVAMLKALGYKPCIEMHEGLTRTYDLYRGHKVQLD